jgi:hypothetical protein
VRLAAPFDDGVVVSGLVLDLLRVVAHRAHQKRVIAVDGDRPVLDSQRP